jgi:hypothetical protein
VTVSSRDRACAALHSAALEHVERTYGKRGFEKSFWSVKALSSATPGSPGRYRRADDTSTFACGANASEARKIATQRPSSAFALRQAEQALSSTQLMEKPGSRIIVTPSASAAGLFPSERHPASAKALFSAARAARAASPTAIAAASAAAADSSVTRLHPLTPVVAAPGDIAAAAARMGRDATLQYLYERLAADARAAADAAGARSAAMVTPAESSNASFAAAQAHAFTHAHAHVQAHVHGHAHPHAQSHAHGHVYGHAWVPLPALSAGPLLRPAVTVSAGACCGPCAAAAAQAPTAAALTTAAVCGAVPEERPEFSQRFPVALGLDATCPSVNPTLTASFPSTASVAAAAAVGAGVSGIHGVPRQATAAAALTGAFETLHRSPTSLTRTKGLAAAARRVDARALAVMNPAAAAAAAAAGPAAGAGAGRVALSAARAQRSLVPGRGGPRIVLHNGLAF